MKTPAGNLFKAACGRLSCSRHHEYTYYRTFDLEISGWDGEKYLFQISVKEGDHEECYIVGRDLHQRGHYPEDVLSQKTEGIERNRQAL